MLVASLDVLVDRHAPAAISQLLPPVTPVGYWIGLKLLKRLPPASVNLTTAIAMLLTGLKLVIDAVLT